MIIKFNSVHLNNFMSFDDETVKLNGLGYTLVSGRNESTEDSALSNGSGKSSIWEGIVWALTGETIRGHKNVVNIFGQDGALVSLDFNVDSNHFVIQRTKDHSKLKSSLTITLNGEDISGKGIRDSEAILKQQLPDVTSSLLSSVIILGQGLPQKFSSNTPSGRKQVLEELSKSDFMIEDLKQRIQERKIKLNSELQELQKKSLAEKTKKDVFLQQLAREGERMTTFSSENIEYLQAEVSANRDKLEEFDVQLEELEHDIASKRAELTDIQESILSVQQQKASELEKIQEKYSELITNVLVDISSDESKLKRDQEELLRLQSIDDVCPTCGQKLQGVVKPDTKPLEDTIKKTQERLKELYEKKVFAQNVKSKEKEQAESQFSITLSDLQKSKSEATSYLKDKQALQQDLQRKKEAVSRNLTSSEQLLNNAEEGRRNCQEAIETLTSNIADADALLLYYNNEEEDTKTHLAVISKMETVVKRDFRGCLLKHVIDFINSRAKIYSKVVFGNEFIDFKQDGNNISISFDNKEYESLSGGEQKKLDIIIQLAIRDMLCRLMNFSSNILVCDEIFDALDVVGCQKIIDLVSVHLEDVSSVFIVTHRDNLCIPCDNEITVIKDVNKISHVIQEA